MARVCLVLWEGAGLSPERPHRCASPYAASGRSRCSTSSPAFAVAGGRGFGHSTRCVVLSPCFNLHFPDDMWCGASFPVFIASGTSTLGRVLWRPLAYLSITLFVFLLSFMSSLYVSDNSLYQMSFASIFSQSVAHFVILLKLSFTEQQFFILMKSSSSAISSRFMPLVFIWNSSPYRGFPGFLVFLLLSSRSFIVLHFMFRPVVNFELVSGKVAGSVSRLFFVCLLFLHADHQESHDRL